MCILNSNWMWCATWAWSRDLNAHLSHPRSDRCDIFLCLGPENGKHIPCPGERVVSSGVGWGGDEGYLVCGFGEDSARHHMWGLGWETSSPRVDAELLGLAKLLGCEKAKQTLGIYKEAHRHLRALWVSLQALESAGASGQKCQAGDPKAVLHSSVLCKDQRNL